MIHLRIHRLNAVAARGRLFSLLIPSVLAGWLVWSISSPSFAYDPDNGDFSKENATDIRVMSYNTLQQFIYNPAKDDAFRRILQAISPDIIIFQEFRSPTEYEIKTRLNNILSYGQPWQVFEGQYDGMRTVLASRYSLSRTHQDTFPTSSTRGVTLGLVDLPDATYSRDLYIMGVHLKCCQDPEEEESRQQSCDAIAAWMGDARDAPGLGHNYISLPQDTPMVVVGDFNIHYWADVQQDDTLRTGDIQDNATYGVDVKGDWDNTDITDLKPADPYTGCINTFHSSGSTPYWRFDRFYYTDSVLTVVHGFILNTTKMNYTQLAAAGLEMYDTTESYSSDHLPLVMDVHIPPPPPTPVPTSTPMPQFIISSGDYNGDGTADIAVFRQSSGLWAVRGITRVYFGKSSDQPVPGDYSGDGTTKIGTFRKDGGLWSIKDTTRAYFGNVNDLAAPGDYNGDGCCDLAVFRASHSLWAIRGVTQAYFGTGGDKLVPGDYNGDGTTEIAVFRSSYSKWLVRGVSQFYLGGETDTVVPGDYDGDGSWDAGIYRPASGLWALRGITRFYFGGSSDQPVPADYDGAAIDDTGIFRSSSGLWAVKGVTRVYYGTGSDIPVTR